MTNPLRELKRYGQSVWYDGLRRAVLVSGELARHIEDGVRLFSEPFAKLLAAIEARRAAADDAGARA
jgi:hypothetical protein